MEITSRALRTVLLLLVASVLIAKIECAPSQQRTNAEESVRHLNRNELLRLFQEDAKWASSSHSNDKSSEELKYQPMPYSPVFTGNGVDPTIPVPHAY
ncbi:AAEL011884-PA [Aedes aegypti]|uniref:AAEL011884-PA n=1 Tax=Aedes aegypti TaxID=7159 RepID=Q16NR6_AEDAE|nr:AAEL011884-PA [Aedes aegypti]